MQLCKLAVGISQLVRDRTGRFSPAAADLGFLELESALGLDADSMLFARHGIDDGLPALLDIAGDLQVRAALRDIDVEVDVREHGVIDLREHGGKDLEHRGARPRVLAAHDAQQRISLGLVGALVHDRQRLPITHVNRLRILEDAGEPQSIQWRLAVKSAFDLQPDHGPAVAMGRQCIELAGTAIRAVAVREFATVDRPLGVWHGRRPSLFFWTPYQYRRGRTMGG